MSTIFVTKTSIYHHIRKDHDMITIIILFALAAIFGVLILLKVLKGKETPKPAVFIHGGLAAVALVLLIIYAMGDMSNAPIISLSLFVIAALGGFILFVRDMTKKKLPIPLALVHAGAAVVAFVLLLVYAFT